MATTAILTFAQRVTVTPLNPAGGNFGTFILEVTNCEPTQTVSDVDMTNSESGGFAEWAPTIVVPEMNLEGLVDTAGNWEAVWITTVQSRLFMAVYLYFTKPANDANPLIYKANLMVKQAKMMGKVDSGGSLWRWSCQTKGVSPFTKAGAGLTGATITGNVNVI